MLARENPFRVERLHALRFRYPPGDDHEALLARVMEHGGRGAIVGPHGSGKTTLMLELAEHLRADGRRVRELRIGVEQHRLSEVERRTLCDALGPRDAFLFDGAGHLTPWSWWCLRRALRAAGLVIVTAHRAGRLPTVLRTAGSPDLLCELVAELDPTIGVAKVREVCREARSDLRQALRSLYESARLSRPAPDPAH
ncbi:MAG: hypothetical protein HZB39_05990 [Planctomycetes bacterium]|nr:hypothetical protein [Planctomycetota bacterium]